MSPTKPPRKALFFLSPKPPKPAPAPQPNRHAPVLELLKAMQEMTKGAKHD